MFEREDEAEMYGIEMPSGESLAVGFGSVLLQVRACGGGGTQCCSLATTYPTQVLSTRTQNYQRPKVRTEQAEAIFFFLFTYFLRTGTSYALGTS